VDIVLSPVNSEDTESLVALRILAMRESLERLGRFDPQRARERFLSGFVPDCTRHIEFKGKRIGFIVLKPQLKELLLDHFYIHPAYQSQGIGAKVLAQVFAEADAQGLAIRVGALKESASNRFYLRHGFKLIEQADWDNYYLRPTRA
jgi:GNAT superfamily N-acetyltransferase